MGKFLIIYPLSLDDFRYTHQMNVIFSPKIDTFDLITNIKRSGLRWETQFQLTPLQVNSSVRLPIFLEL